MIRVEVQLSFGKHACSRSLVKSFEMPEVYSFTVPLYGRAPFVTCWVNAHNAGLIGGRALNIAHVFAAADETKIAQPIVGPVTIDVVNLAAFNIAEVHGPDDAMRKIGPAKNSANTVALTM